MEYKTHNTNDELTHWGVKGMRWGVRRYQNADGSLTNAGKKRYTSEMQLLKEKEQSLKKRQATKDKFDKLSAKRAELSEWENQLNGKKTSSKPAKKKTASEMSDEELWQRTARMQMEANYYNAQKNLAAANPQKVSAGQKFVSSLMSDVVAPAAKNAGKSWLENTLKDKLGLNDVDPLKKLENKYKKLEWEKKIKDIQKDPDDDDDIVKALEFFRNTSAEDRQELSDAAKMFENMDKIRKKGKSKD